MWLQSVKNCAAALLVMAAASASALPRGPQPSVRLPLADLGVPGVPQTLRESGASMLTVHFVDNSHLLLTYGSRGLVERIPGDPPDDNDRGVTALLVELPSGKVLAQTKWHFHDYSRYLWALGDGRFLLRNRSTLTGIAPLANLKSGDAFREMPFVKTPGKLSAVVVSPEHDLVTVKSTEHGGKEMTDTFGMPVPNSGPTVDTYFFDRVEGEGTRESPVRAVSAGVAKVRGAIPLSLNGRGYLFSKSSKRDRWNMKFEGFDGQQRKLSDVASSCPPQMQFVSPSQFVVFTCRGSTDNILLSAFDFAPHEMWEEPMSGMIAFDQFAYAQQAGRFAMSRRISGPATTMGPIGDDSSAQEVRVYQVASGDLLVKLTCSPNLRNGQNFDLSADGLSALVVRNGVIEVYQLPPMSAQDKKDLAEVRQFEPPSNASPIKLARILEDAAEVVAIAPAPSQVSAAPAAGVPAASTPATGGPVGDVDLDLPRKPPSLLNPGEEKPKP